MTFVDPEDANDPASSPGPGGGLGALLPLALALLADDSPGETYGKVRDGIRRWAGEEPFDALLTTVVGGGIAFWLAEREKNPACASPWDGILYMATCLNVGYDNLFPTTAAGHALAAAVQTLGPAMASAALEPPAAERRAAAEAAAETQRQILDKLTQIVTLLERGQGAPDTSDAP